MLAPSVERTQGPAQTFGEEARLAWDRLARSVRDRGASFMLRRNGIVRLATTPDDEARLRESLMPADVWLSAADVRKREPAVIPVRGAALYSGDGVVDAPACIAALRGRLESDKRVSFVTARAMELASKGSELEVVDSNDTIHRATHVVLAAGAWSGQIAGLPVAVPVRPVRGTLLALGGVPVSDPVYAGTGHWYAFPRGGHTLVGATSDEAGFDGDPGPGDVDRLLEGAATLLADVATRPQLGTLTGLRPITPDSLACLGQARAVPGLLYACGHGRNGFLQAPMTGEVVATLIAGGDPGFDLGPFSPERFG